jgi:hypothetical protein
MKSISLLALSFTILLQSCSKEDAITPTTASTVDASSRKGVGEGNSTNVSITQANLLPAISTYLTANYAGYTFVNAYSEATNGTIVNYDVNITLNSIAYHVVFDATGKFVSSVTGSVNKKQGVATTNVAVAQADLLSAISTYLIANYNGYTFVNAYSEAVNGTIINYDVNITLNSVAYHVVFDATGKFVSVGKGNGKNTGTKTTNVAVTQANLLAAISTYLTANYSGYTFVNAYSEASNGVIVNYDVNIKLNNVSYHVVFDVAGTFVSVK